MLACPEGRAYDACHGGRVTGHHEDLGRGTWRLVANLPPVVVNGKRRYPRTTKVVKAKGIRAADKALADWLAELEAHDCTDPDRLTVGEVLRRWLAEDAKRTVRPKTYERYAQLVDKHLKPWFGAMRAAELTPADLSAFYADKQEGGRLDGRDGGLSAQTCLHMHRVLHRAFQWAVYGDLMARNPAARVRKPPSPSGPRRRTWTDEQIADAIELARPTMLYVPTVLAGWGGLRRGEICGLVWDDVLWDANAVVVRTSVEQTKDGLHDLPTKTRAGERVVVLPSQAIDVLREHCTRQDEMQHGARPALECSRPRDLPRRRVADAPERALEPLVRVGRAQEARAAHLASTTCATATRPSSTTPACAPRPSRSASGTRRRRSRAPSTSTARRRQTSPR